MAILAAKLLAVSAEEFCDVSPQRKRCRFLTRGQKVEKAAKFRRLAQELFPAFVGMLYVRKGKQLTKS